MRFTRLHLVWQVKLSYHNAFDSDAIYFLYAIFTVSFVFCSQDSRKVPVKIHARWDSYQGNLSKFITAVNSSRGISLLKQVILDATANPQASCGNAGVAYVGKNSWKTVCIFQYSLVELNNLFTTILLLCHLVLWEKGWKPCKRGTYNFLLKLVWPIEGQCYPYIGNSQLIVFHMIAALGYP